MATKSPQTVAATLPGYAGGRRHSVAAGSLTLFTDFDVAAYTHAARGRIPVDKTLVGELADDLRADLGFLWRLDSAALRDPSAACQLDRQRGAGDGVRRNLGVRAAVARPCGA